MLKNRLFSYLAIPPTLVAMVTRKMKYLMIFIFSLLTPSISGYPKNKFIPFAISCLNNYHFKMVKKCNFSPVAIFTLPWKQIETQNQTSVCATFQVVSMLRMLYKLMSTHLCLLVILFHKLRHFSNFAIMLLLWLPWIPNIETF